MDGFSDDPSASSSWNATEKAPVTVPEPPTYIVVTVTTFYCVLFVTGISGNILIMSVIVKFREMRTCTNYFLFNLSFADLLVVTICLQSALINLYTKEVWILGSFMCKLVPFLENAVAHASILTILAISFERYYAICHPLKVQYTCTFQRTRKLLVLIWFVSLSSTIPFPIMTKHLDTLLLDGTPVKVCKLFIKDDWQKIYLASSITILFFVPLMVLVIVYSVMIRKLMMDTVCADRNLDCIRNPGLHSRRQVVYMMAAVVLVFFVCLFPVKVFRLWIVFTVNPNIEKLGLEGYLNLLYFVRVMFSLNSVLNPVLYSVFSSRFRCVFVKLLACQKRSALNAQENPNDIRRIPSLLTSKRTKRNTLVTDSIALTAMRKQTDQIHLKAGYSKVNSYQTSFMASK